MKKAFVFWTRFNKFFHRAMPRHSAMVVFILAVFCNAAFCETRYVSDVMYVFLRSGPGDQNSTAGTVKSDDPLEVLSESDDFLHVRTETGETGYIKKRYTTSATPDAIVIERLKKKIERLGAETNEGEDFGPSFDELKETNRSLAAKKEELERDATRNAEEISRLTAELKRVEKSYHALLNNHESSSELKKENEKIKEEIQGLRVKTSEFEKNSVIDKFLSAGNGWILTGGLVCMLGWFLGRLSVPARKKKYF